MLKFCDCFTEDVRDELRSKKIQDVLGEAKIKYTCNGVCVSDSL